MQEKKSGLSEFKNEGTGDKIFDICVWVIVVVAVCVTLYPFLYVASISVSDGMAVAKGEVMFLPKGWDLEAYHMVMRYQQIWVSYGNTFLYTIVGTAFNIVFTCLAAYPLSRKQFFLRKKMNFLLAFTMYFSGGLIPTYLVVKGLGLVNQPAVMVILGCVSVYDIIITRSFFVSNIPQEMLEAAHLDGCTNLRFFTSIVIPLSGAIIAVIALYSAVGYWNGFFNALIYLSKQEYFPLQLIIRDLLLVSQTMASSTDGD